MYDGRNLFTLKINTVRLIILLSIAGFFGQSCKSIHPMISAETKGEMLKKTFPSDGWSMPYRILYPQKIQKKYPLLVFMHGAGERGTDNERQLIHGKKWLMDNNLSYPAVVVLPQCPTEDYWSSVDRNTNAEGERKFVFNNKPPTAALTAVMALIDSMRALPYIDSNRVYITGLSMGGMATWEILWRKPGMVAAAAPICGGVYLPMAKEISKTACIRIYHGDKDQVVIPQFSRDIYKALKDNGANVMYKEYAGVEHNAWTYVFQEKDFFEWMFSCKRPGN